MRREPTTCRLKTYVALCAAAATVSTSEGHRVPAFEPIQVSAIDLISMARRVQGWPSGSATDSRDAVAFAHKHGVRPMIEKFPLDEAQPAFERMMSGDARFRVVLDVVPE